MKTNLIAGAIALFFVSIAYSGELIDLTSKQVRTVEMAVRNSMKDPDSAIFGEMAGSVSPSSGNLIVCGYVNGKNSFGGYTGNQMYLGMFIDDAYYVHNIMPDIPLDACKRVLREQ